MNALPLECCATCGEQVAVLKREGELDRLLDPAPMEGISSLLEPGSFFRLHECPVSLDEAVSLGVRFREWLSGREAGSEAELAEILQAPEAAREVAALGLLRDDWAAKNVNPYMRAQYLERHRLTVRALNFAISVWLEVAAKE